MDLLVSAAKIAVRYRDNRIAAVSVAQTFPDLIRYIDSGIKEVQALKHNLQQGKAEAKKVSTKILATLDPKYDNSYFKKDVNQIMSKLDKAIDMVTKKLTTRGWLDISSAYRDELQEHWDPEMFADGQTRSDYAPNPLDPLFDLCQKLESMYSTFSYKFMDKQFNLGTLNTTLMALLPLELQGEGEVNTKAFMNLAKGDFEEALVEYKSDIEKLSKESMKYQNSASSLSPGTALSALVMEAEKDRDSWTATFARSLMDQMNRRKEFSPKQRQVVEDKFKKYKIGPVNYSLRW